MKQNNLIYDLISRSVKTEKIFSIHYAEKILHVTFYRADMTKYNQYVNIIKNQLSTNYINVDKIILSSLS